MSDSDVLNVFCEALSYWGVDPQQAALVATGLALMAGLKVSYRVGLMATCCVVRQAAKGYAWLTHPGAAAEVDRAVLAALSDPGAQWNDLPGSELFCGQLVGTGVVATLSRDMRRAVVRSFDGDALDRHLSRKAVRQILATARASQQRWQQERDAAEREKIVRGITAASEQLKA